MKFAEPMLRLGHAKAEFEYWREFLTPAHSEALFASLRSKAPWREQRIAMYGKQVPMPRLTCWYGDEGAAYRYSGVLNNPIPWSAELGLVRSLLLDFVGITFNSVLLNYYRSGNDSLGWHSDDEPELGNEPVIASVSLGGVRKFEVKELSNEGVRFRLMLTSGSLLVMRGNAQRFWRHSIPKVKEAAPRINLTFRNVQLPSAQAHLL